MKNTLAIAICFLLGMSAKPAAAGMKFMRNSSIKTASYEALSIELNEQRGYSLEKIKSGNVEYPCGDAGEFPVFQFMKGGQRLDVSGNSQDLKAKLFDQGGMRQTVVYDYLGSVLEINYRVWENKLALSFTVQKEGAYKFISVGARRGLVMVSRTSLENMAAAKIVAPARQGLEIGFAEEKGLMFSSENNYFGCFGTIDEFNGWNLNANFVAIIKDQKALLVHPGQHAGRFFYGIAGWNGNEYLFINTPLYFRPLHTPTDEMPLVHKTLDVELTFSRDENGDGLVNWVDVGIAYRNRNIKPCKNVDPFMKEAVVGKLHAGTGYVKLLEGIKEITYAPQIWWLTGAHTEGNEVYDQNYWAFHPNDSHGDFYMFKAEAEKHNARIGIHQNLDDVYQDAGWDPGQVRLNASGNLWAGGVWGGRQSYLRDLPRVEADGRMYQWINDWFSVWLVKKGETWHYDVFAALLNDNYDTRHPATHETDFAARYRLLEHVVAKGIHISSEMIMEGLHENLSLGLVNSGYYHYSEVPAADWKIVKEIPLFPVLFLGRAYVGDLMRLSYAKELLLGVKKTYWFGAIDTKIVKDFYFKQNVFWSQICDREVVNVKMDGTTIAMTYSDRSELVVDEKKDTFVYWRDGVRYDHFSPFNPMGIMGVWSDEKSLAIQGREFIMDESRTLGQRCLFTPGGQLTLSGNYSSARVDVLKKTGIAFLPEQPLAVELVETAGTGNKISRYVFALHSDKPQKVVVKTLADADFYDEVKKKELAKGKKELELAVDQAATISVSEL